MTFHDNSLVLHSESKSHNAAPVVSVRSADCQGNVMATRSCIPACGGIVGFLNPDHDSQSNLTTLLYHATPGSCNTNPPPTEIWLPDFPLHIPGTSEATFRI